MFREACSPAMHDIDHLARCMNTVCKALDHLDESFPDHGKYISTLLYDGSCSTQRQCNTERCFVYNAILKKQICDEQVTQVYDAI